MATAFVWEQYDGWRAARRRLVISSSCMWCAAGAIALLPRWRWAFLGILIGSTGVTVFTLGRANRAAARTIAAVRFSHAVDCGSEQAVELAWQDLMSHLTLVEEVDDVVEDSYPTAVDLRGRRRERRTRLRAARGH
jgi:hypothetical protein